MIPQGSLIHTIHFNYLIGSAAIDILILLTISIGIIAEMHRDHPPHRKPAAKQRQSLEA